MGRSITVMGAAVLRKRSRLIHVALDTEVLEDLARNLLDRGVRRVEDRDVFPSHQPVGLFQFPAALLQRGVAAAGAALLADLRQAIGVDGQTEQPAAVRA